LLLLLSFSLVLYFFHTTADTKNFASIAIFIRMYPALGKGESRLRLEKHGLRLSDYKDRPYAGHIQFQSALICAMPINEPPNVSDTLP
jgi:hypothetical protein